MSFGEIFGSEEVAVIVRRFLFLRDEDKNSGKLALLALLLGAKLL